MYFRDCSGRFGMSSNNSVAFTLEHLEPYKVTPPKGLIKFRRYLNRLKNFRSMDFEFAYWQMLYLLISPKKL